MAQHDLALLDSARHCLHSEADCTDDMYPEYVCVWRPAKAAKPNGYYPVCALLIGATCARREQFQASLDH